MKNEKINSFGVCMLLFALSKASFFGAGFHYIYKNTHTGALFSVLLGIVIGFIIVLGILKITGEKPLPLEIKKYFPKPIAFMFIFIIIICALGYACLAYWRIIDFITSQYLTNTPALLIGILIISLVFYTLTKNIEVLTRFATIAFFINILFLLTNVFGLLPYIELNNLKPIHLNFPVGFLKASFGFALLFAGPCFFTTIIGRNSLVDENKLNKKYIFYYFFSALGIFTMFFLVLSCLGNEVIGIYTYPVYVVLKKITLLNFIENVENVTSIMWFLYLLILLLTCLFYVKNTILYFLKNINQKKQNIISFFLSLFTLLLPLFLLEKNYSLTEKLYTSAPLLINLILVMILIICLIVFKIKKT